MFPRLAALGLSAAFLTSAASAETPAGPDLDAVFADLDRRLFEVGFNDCDLDETAALVAQDLEFYHDQGGVTRSRDAFLTNVEQNICSREEPLRRDLVAGSMRIEPLRSGGELYGVIQFGAHTFTIEHADGSETLTGQADFAHLWLLGDDGEWVLSRVLSYAHRAPD
ncbi:DUF4440 domain-containing protein [Maricaulis sp.]|uniref:DUF4440 domain-containing protein n=1 Tax=Maricaulis sp. TaxID=1486257 RepID=UPI00262C0421|nr:DUF4440 domain-containing protein [Maricaulis sp.]